MSVILQKGRVRQGLTVHSLEPVHMIALHEESKSYVIPMASHEKWNPDSFFLSTDDPLLHPGYEW